MRPSSITPSIESQRRWFGAHAATVLPDLEMFGYSLEPELRKWVIEARVAKANTRFDRWLGWVPTRIISSRLRGRLFGSALDRIRNVLLRGGGRLELALTYAGPCAVFACEVVRYVVRCIFGKTLR